MSSVATVPAHFLEGAMCLQLRLERPGMRRRVDPERVDVKADKDWLHLSKDIFDSAMFKRILAHDRAVRIFVYGMSVPAPFLKGGLYLIRDNVVPEVDSKLEQLRIERQALIEAFLTEYASDAADGLIARAKARLEDLFEEKDYPHVDVLRRGFDMATSYLAFSTPTKLKTISAVIFEREKEKAEARMTEAVDEIKLLLRSEMKKVVDHMVDRLTPGDDNRPKIFRDSIIENAAEFLRTFSFRNICNDEDLDNLVAQAKGLLQGRDADALRESAVARESVALGFQEIKGALDKLVEVVPSRMIDVEE